MEKIIAVKLEQSDFRDITGLIETHLHELKRQRDFYRKKHSKMTIIVDQVIDALIEKWERILTAIRKELSK